MKAEIDRRVYESQKLESYNRTCKHIGKAVENEHAFAVGHWGKSYASDHEAYAVLLEEIQEADKCFLDVKNAMDDIWDMVKDNDESAEIKDGIRTIRHHLLLGVLEMVQCMAVICKWEES